MGMILEKKMIQNRNHQKMSALKVFVLSLYWKVPDDYSHGKLSLKVQFWQFIKT